MKKALSKLFGLTLMLFSAIATGCSDKGNSSSQIVDDGVTSIELRATGLNDDVLTIMEGNSTTIAVSYKPSNANPNLNYTVADQAIATMEGSKLKALKAGQTTLTVSAAKVSKTIGVNVESYIPLTGVRFNEEEMVIETGVRKQLKYTLVPENATTKVINFSVEPENEGVKVNSSGIVEVEQEVEAGKTFVVTAKGAKEPEATGSIRLKIKEYEVEDVLLLDNSFSKEINSLIVPLDEPYRVLFAMVTPEKALPYESKLPVQWSSSNNDVVTVNEKGRLSFHKQGNATITMTSTVQNKTFTKTCSVTVTEPSGDFIENYFIPASYISGVATSAVTTAYGWQTFIDFRNGGTASTDAKRMVFQNYKPQTGPSSWFAGGGYCVEMGGWDNIHSGLEDDDLEGGGMANLYMWTKVNFGEQASKIRTYFEYRQTDGTFKYKLRHTLIDVSTKEVLHLSGWQTSSFNEDPHLSGTDTYIESDVPQNWRGKNVIMMLEYDDIDYTTDHILNGCDSVNVKYFNVLNDTGEIADNALWVIGDSNTTTEFTNTLIDDVANDTSMTLFRDTISGRTIAPASSIGIVDHIDSKFYENNFEPFGEPKVILIHCGGNDLFWAKQPGNPLKVGTPDSTDKTCTYGALKYMLNYFTTRYPEAQIILDNVKYRIIPEATDFINYTQEEANTFNTNIIPIVNSYSNVHLLDICKYLWDYAEHNETKYNALFISDHIHFNTAGQTLMRALWSEEIKKYYK